MQASNQEQIRQQALVIPSMYSDAHAVNTENLNVFEFTPPAWGSNYLVKFEWLPPVSENRHDLGTVAIKQVYLHATPILDKLQGSGWYDEEDLIKACFEFLSALR